MTGQAGLGQDKYIKKAHRRCLGSGGDAAIAFQAACSGI